MIGTIMKSLKIIFSSSLLVLGILVSPGLSTAAQSETNEPRTIHTLAAATSATVFAETSYGAYGGYNLENGSYWYRDGYPYPVEKGFNQGGWGFSGSQSYGSYHPNNCHANIDPNGLCFETGDVKGYHDQERQIEWCPFGGRPEYCKNPNWANPIYENYGYCTANCGDYSGYNYFRYGGYIDKGWANGSRGNVKNGGTLGTAENPDAYRVFFTSDNPAYYPSGPQHDVPIIDVLGGGWRLCWSGKYSESSAVVSIQAACKGSYTIMAGSYEAFGQGAATLPSYGAAISLATDGLTACLVTAKGVVKCWGSSSDRWGNSTRGRLNVPSDLRPSKSVALANGQVCALSIDGVVTCWGAEDSTDWAYKLWPSQMRPIKQLKGGDAMCALDVDNNLMCKGSWGRGLSVPFGQISDFSVRYDKACAITLDSDLSCWGDAIVDGRPANLTKAKAVSTAYVWGSGNYSGNTCAIDLQSYLYCWGSDPYGLGAPNVPAGLEKVKSVSTSPFQTCAVTITNQLRCWGWLPGVGTPILPTDLGEISSVTQGYTQGNSYGDFFVSTCAITITGAPRCWGRNPAINIAPTLSPEQFDIAGIPIIAGSAKVGAQLSASAGTWDSGTNFNYQWFRDGLAIEGAVNSTYTPTVIDFQHLISVAVTGSKVGFSPITKSTSIVSVGTGLMTKSSSPTISGTATVGSTLSASTGAWDSGASFYYQWLRDGVAIANATSKSYEPALSDAGHLISVRVTSSLDGYQPISLESSPVTIATPYSALPSVNWSKVASSSDGTKLAAIAGDHTIWASSDSGANWVQRNGSGITSNGQVIPSGSRNWDKVASSEDGTKLAAILYNGSVWTSSDAGLTWTERAASGARLWSDIASSSDGTKLVALAYPGGVWTSNDSGLTWTERVNAGYRNWGAVASNADGNVIVASWNDGNISVSHDSGNTWTVSSIPSNFGWWRALASNADGSRLYGVEWCGGVWESRDSGTTWSKNQQFQDNTYHSISVNSDGTKVIVGSFSDGCWGQPTEAKLTLGISPNTFALKQPLSIDGYSTVGSRLAANSGNYPVGTSMSYQWLRDGVLISGANGSKYSTTPQDLNHQISYQLSLSKSGYENLTISSSALTITKKVFTRLVKPKVTGSYRVDSTLRTALTPMGTGATYSYQWLRDGSPIAGATGRTYTLGLADLGAAVTFQVCGARDLYESTCLSSDAPSVVDPGQLGRLPAVRMSFRSTKVGSIIQGNSGVWDSGVVLSYQWLRDGVDIQGETSLTHQVSADDRGHNLSFKVLAQKTGYTDIVKHSVAKLIP